MLIGANSLGPGDYSKSVRVGGETRTYLVHIPAAYTGATPAPLVLAFHGGATDAAVMLRFCGLNDKADQAGFIVAYPNGTGETKKLLTWNAGNCCGYAKRNNVDDVAFVRAVLDDMDKAVRIDAKRVYATGMSNGAMMCYRLAAELSDHIAAIAPVAGTMGVDGPAPGQPVPVLHFHGSEDQFVPIGGGQGPRSLSQTDFASVDETIRAWVKIDGCRQEPVVTKIGTKDANGLTVVRSVYPAGPSGAEVVLYTIQGGGHTWPGQVPRMAMLGKSTTVISANDLMWEFFQKHPMN
jgi:polyhydroxybutyrate depolymerase